MSVGRTQRVGAPARVASGPARPRGSRRPLGARGAAALEFAMVAPVFVLFVMAILGVGLAGFYQLTLDDAVRDAARQIQIAGPAGASGGAFATAVCSEFGLVATSCVDNLTYNVQSNAPPASFSAMTPLGMPAAGALPNAFPTLASNANVLIQVAFPLPFTLPYIGPAVTFTGTNSLLSTTTVRVEPHG